MSKRKLTNVTITRSHLNPMLEIYFEGERIGHIEVDPKGSHRAILRITAPPFLRFVRAELDAEAKEYHIFPERRRDVPRGTSVGKRKEKHGGR